MSALALVRALHYAAVAQAFGAPVFATLVAPAGTASDAVDRLLMALARWSVNIALLSWLGWLLLQAPAMAGIELRALDVPTLDRVVRATSFGRVWLGRLVLIVAVAVVLTLRRSVWRDGVAAIAALALIATLAATAHAAADSDKTIHMSADALHLVAAGAWLGALLPLAVTRRRTLAPRAHAITCRFSSIGVAAVVLLLATGIVNGVSLVGSWPPLFGTAYGQWLIAKIALFAMMLALAMTNRLRWTGDVARGGSQGEIKSVHIARNARIEAALGVGVLATVGVLGLSVPAAHDETRWRFPFRLSFDEGVLPQFVRAYPTTYLHPPLRIRSPPSLAARHSSPLIALSATALKGAATDQRPRHSRRSRRISLPDTCSVISTVTCTGGSRTASTARRCSPDEPTDGACKNYSAALYLSTWVR